MDSKGNFMLNKLWDEKVVFHQMWHLFTIIKNNTHLNKTQWNVTKRLKGFVTFSQLCKKISPKLNKSRFKPIAPAKKNEKLEKLHRSSTHWNSITLSKNSNYFRAHRQIKLKHDWGNELLVNDWLDLLDCGLIEASISNSLMSEKELLFQNSRCP